MLSCGADVRWTHHMHALGHADTSVTKRRSHGHGCAHVAVELVRVRVVDGIDGTELGSG